MDKQGILSSNNENIQKTYFLQAGFDSDFLV